MSDIWKNGRDDECTALVVEEGNQSAGELVYVGPVFQPPQPVKNPFTGDGLWCIRKV